MRPARFVLGLRHISRHAPALTKMPFSTPSSPSPPTAPAIVVLGSTGTGKSDLAIELATRFRGEIINADAMQMYRGLPVVTNQLSLHDQHGIPHHLLGHIEPDSAPWVVGDFKREASRLVGEIRARGRVPVVVGGTTYYILGLLAGDALIEAEKDMSLSPSGPLEANGAGGGDLPELEEPTERLVARLKEADPAMAEKWHPNDRRKIQRSLEIFIRTGRRASDIYAEQQARKSKTMSPPSAADPELDSSLSLEDALLFWVYSDPEVLMDRLDRRVDKMLELGMMKEIEQMWNLHRRGESSEDKADPTKGIWQSIGFKQLEPYMEALNAPEPDPEKAERLRTEGLQAMKSATRRYAKYQTRYIRRNFLPHLLPDDTSRAPNLFLIDSTDPSSWSSSVSGPASHITTLFLSGEPLPDAASLSGVASIVLDDARRAVSARATERLCQRVCHVCQVTTTTESAWQIHVDGRRHRSACRNARRRALVVVDRAAQEVGDDRKGVRHATEEDDESSDSDLGLGLLETVDANSP